MLNLKIGNKIIKKYNMNQSIDEEDDDSPI